MNFQKLLNPWKFFLPPEPAAPPQVNPVSKILLDAAALIEEHGWTQGEYHSLTRGYCIMGAIEDAVKAALKPSTWQEHDRERTLVALVEIRLTALMVIHPIHWNDVPTRKKEEVLAALRKAATN